MKSTLGVIASARRSYQALISSPEERALFEGWSRTWEEYLKAADGVLEISRKGGANSAPEANELFRKTARSVANQSDGYLKKAIDLNNRGAADETRNAAQGYARAFATVSAIVILAVIAGIAVGFWFIRDISRSIPSIVKPMQALGERDLTIEIPHCGEKTETGAMADALQIFRDALIAKRAADSDAARAVQVKIERGKSLDELISRFEAVIGKIVETVSTASTGLEGHAAGLSDTANRAQSLATAGTQQVSSNVTDVQRGAVETGSAASEVLSAAKSLAEDSARLKLEVRKFIEGVRAA